MEKNKTNKKLSKIMQCTFDKMKSGKTYSSYELGVSLRTMFALNKRGLVDYRMELGSIWFPRTCIKWWIKIDKSDDEKIYT